MFLPNQLYNLPNVTSDHMLYSDCQHSTGQPVTCSYMPVSCPDWRLTNVPLLNQEIPQTGGWQMYHYWTKKYLRLEGDKCTIIELRNTSDWRVTNVQLSNQEIPQTGGWRMYHYWPKKYLRLEGDECTIIDPRNTPSCFPHLDKMVDWCEFWSVWVLTSKGTNDSKSLWPKSSSKMIHLRISLVKQKLQAYSHFPIGVKIDWRISIKNT